MQKKELENIKAFIKFVRPKLRSCIHILAWITFVALLRLPVPLLSKYLIDDVLAADSISMLNVFGLIMLGYYFFNFVSQYIRSYLIIVFKEKMLYVLEIKLFRHILSLPISFFQKHQSGYLSSLLLNDTNNLGNMFSENVFGFVLDILTFTFGISIMFFFHWKLALICVMILPFYAYTTYYFGKRVKEKSLILQENIGRMQGNMQESLMGIPVVKAFHRENFESIKHSRYWRKMLKERIKLALTLNVSTILVASIGSLGPLAVLWYGGYQIIEGHLTIGTMIAFSGFVNYIFGPVQKLSDLNFRIKESMASWERLQRILNLEAEKESGDARSLPAPKGVVRYENVSFAYEPEAPVLKNINLTAAPGELVAVVGRSGVGKSTLLSLLFRFYDPPEGEISIDGINIRDLKLGTLRTVVSSVSQHTHLFGGTITDNILYGAPRAGREEVIDAARAANAHDFINSLPEKYDTLIGERGVKLSGGQKQRIDIARAVINKSCVLVLDEATAFLDSESEEAIQKSIQELKKTRTVFVIAHKLATVKKADQILVLDDGCIVAKGGHTELSKNCEIYRDLFAGQLEREQEPDGLIKN